VTQQPDLFGAIRRDCKPWKRVRQTSAAQYAHLRDTGTLAKRRDAVLRAVAAIYNATQEWPTSCEVQYWLAIRGELPQDGNPNHVRPRLTELAALGVVERGPKRKSHVTDIVVLTWRVRSR
jgi:hypothetical protein